MARGGLLLTDLARFEGLAWLALRLFVGGFLVWGVWDNIGDAARMAEFETFLARLGCPLPHMAAPLSVWTQLVAGGLIITGLFMRAAGVLLMANFIVAVILLALAGQDLRQLFPPAMLIFIGAVFATSGAGRFSLDQVLTGSRRR